MMKYNNKIISKAWIKVLTEFYRNCAKVSVPYDIVGNIAYLLKHYTEDVAGDPVASPDPKLNWTTREQHQISLHLLARELLVNAWR